MLKRKSKTALYVLFFREHAQSSTSPFPT